MANYKYLTAIIGLVLLFLLVILLTLFTPIGYFLENKYLGSDGYQFRNSDGTILQGKTTIELEDTFGEISWRINDLDLTNLEPTTQIKIHNQHASLVGQLIVNTEDIYLINTSGNLTKNGFNALLEKLGTRARISNGFEINIVEILHSTGYFIRANGTLSWDGGLVTLNENNQIVLPAMIGKLSTYDDGIRLSIYQKDNNLLLGEIDVSDGYIAHFKFMERFGNYLPMIPKQFMKGNPDAIMFEIKQAI